MIVEKKDVRPILNLYGATHQMIKASEELSELQTVLLQDATKGKRSRKEVAEEMADVYVMLQQVALAYDISDEKLKMIAECKIRRTKRRMQCE